MPGYGKKKKTKGKKKGKKPQSSSLAKNVSPTNTSLGSHMTPSSVQITPKVSASTHTPASMTLKATPSTSTPVAVCIKQTFSGTKFSYASSSKQTSSPTPAASSKSVAAAPIKVTKDTIDGILKHQLNPQQDKLYEFCKNILENYNAEFDQMEELIEVYLKYF